ncbi:hypothetical protein TTHERM_000071009 (macronuclear) [Tetrahymena thermophila SB210]|uniref:Uncharacterized protein n=1 Tax=Tetrahymena thermophila (strain SB210) TaxID=312017 RepID=W7XKE0_TETTS|nr:hypothetical protein TTHERM_000071009 [Tetrahymena thermophila SB210]EWS76446.1 hypothetical protein TTHERM_000071009 [Tetrahymena thermophila SB210]|eukprot:XP_012651019.1 hypothetical protein TTHERM_000071009 [Tetrahymena thermophila SB210]
MKIFTQETKYYFLENTHHNNFTNHQSTFFRRYSNNSISLQCGRKFYNKLITQPSGFPQKIVTTYQAFFSWGLLKVQQITSLLFREADIHYMANLSWTSPLYIPQPQFPVITGKLNVSILRIFKKRSSKIISDVIKCQIGFLEISQNVLPLILITFSVSKVNCIINGLVSQFNLQLLVNLNLANVIILVLEACSIAFI